ncbi:MAG: glutamine amidotransferase [Chromatiales bacterium]|nr:glutamine amidotransferase [Chromatiales bacterium]
MRPLLIIKTGEKLLSLADTPGDYEEWIARGMGLASGDYRVVAPYRGELLPPVNEVCGAVITGSGAMVTDGDGWIEATAAWLRQAVNRNLPILGICFGHQLLAHALGGRVDYNPAGVEVGTIEVSLNPQGQKDPLLSNLPSTFPAQLSHRQSVLTLPPQAQLLAASAMEGHQAFRCGDRCWGIQFHPEFDEAVIAHFIDYYREQLSQEGRDASSLQQIRRPSPLSHRLLSHFATIVHKTCETGGNGANF